MFRRNSDRELRTARLAVVAGLLVCLGVSHAHAQFTVSDSNVGYIDSAIPANVVRLRFDAGYDTFFPDRAEFQYAKYNTPGPPLSEIAIASHQELAAYLEYAPFQDFSLFAEIPVRWINPVVNNNTGGLYDMNAGAKLALVQNDVSVLSLQLRTIMATGDTDAGLSAGHASLEPAVLYYRELTDRLTLEAEFRDWIPIDASQTGPGGSGGGGGGGGGGTGQGGNREFGGNVLRYGVGLGYDLVDDSRYRVTPITELIGWQVLDGLKSTPQGQRISAAGDTIVNLKCGMRFGMRDGDCGCANSNALFIGYGIALTDAHWYQDIVRAELRWGF